MRTDLLKLAGELAERGEPYALALVVRREPATSARPGNAAIFTRDGSWHGWLGGSCIHPTVARVAQEVMAEGRTRMLSFSPDPGAETRPGVTAVAMTCQSGGIVDVYIEPVLPPDCLLLFGNSPIVAALARLGAAMGLEIHTVGATEPTVAARRYTGPRDPELPATLGDRRVAAVVAAMGDGDEEGVLAALELAPIYLGVVASRHRFAGIREVVLARGADPGAVERMSSPAGLDIGAREPAEIALSILAEMVQLRAAGAEAKTASTAADEAPADEALDPVCGMTVAVGPDSIQAERGGATYYFCCGGCRERFLAAPERYLGDAG